MGYCGQYDVIIPNHTVYEIITFYAKLKGV